MKTEKNILLAFLLNLAFSIFEIIGGLFTNSVAIVSDAIHDLGDALSIGISYFLEKKSKRKPDEKYTYGYTRYSVLGATITTCILLISSILVIVNAVGKIMNPVEINYSGMIFLAGIGCTVNFLAAYFTRGGHSLNQKSVNLHMLEDVLGWAIVFIGAVIMKFTDISIIDPLMSIIVAVFIFVNSLKNFKTILNLFLEKTPEGVSVKDLKKHLLDIDGVVDIHHIHIWSLDGFNNYATMHVVVDKMSADVKKAIKEELKDHGIDHVTLEIETKKDKCEDVDCHIQNHEGHAHHHHHH